MSDAAIKTAQAHIAAGRLAQARTVLSAALTRSPNSPPLLSLITWVHLQQGETAQAKFFAERSCALQPNQADPLFNLGKLLATSGETDRGIECFQRAVTLDPDNPATLSGLTNALNIGHRYKDAEALCRKALERWPDHVELMVDLAMSLQGAGRVREAVEALRRAAALHPDDPFATTLLANTMNYAGNVPPQEVFEAHLAYGRRVQRAFPGHHAPPSLDQNPDRRLRIGLLSGDLRTHAVGFFTMPLLEHYDRSALEIVCFSTSSIEDAMSARFRALATRWCPVAHLPMAGLAEEIRKQRIDILVELSGHTGGHRLDVFCLRPAAIGVTYFGYPNTTGVPGVDYRLVDSITDPPEPWYDDLASEKLWRLDPCFLCYQGPKAAPDPAPPPSAAGAPFTFGSFNNLAKHDDLALDLYRRVLDAVPGSRFMLKYGGLGNPRVREAVLERFSGAGIDPGRLILDPPGKNALETLPAYARMDVMLDSFPYHGTTTTCEALYMGVPVVTLTGRVCAARVGVSILTNAGHPELVASTPEEYVDIAATLARDPARLASIRGGLRPKLLASPVCDGPGFSRRFEDAMRQMWRRWCQA